MRAFLFVGILFCCAKYSFAQVENQSLTLESNVNAADTGKLQLNVSSLCFLRNTEYFNPIDLGKTLFGYQILPTLSYTPIPVFKIEAGVFARQDFGGTGYYSVLPAFSMMLQKNNYSIAFGKINGALSHRLIEPLYNIESQIENPIENGFQFKVIKNRIWSDTWINWKKMIYPGSNFQEKISAGTSTFYDVLKKEKFSATLIIQALVDHQGGQINVDTAAIVSSYNISGGLRLAYYFPKGAFIKEIRSDNYYSHFSYDSAKKIYAYSSGTGLYLNLLLRSKVADLMFSYWNGNKYIAPMGTAIYQSVSVLDPSYTEKSRQLLFMRFLYEKKMFNDLSLNLRFEPFYDINNETLEYSYSVYFTYRHTFDLAKIKS